MRRPLSDAPYGWGRTRRRGIGLGAPFSNLLSPLGSRPARYASATPTIASATIGPASAIVGSGYDGGSAIISR